jgi:enoyl-CoA hydratase
MNYENLLAAFHDGILTITINRAEKLNALNKKTIEEIGVAVSKAQNAAEVRVIIITGAGTKAFIAGADISEFSDYGEKEGALMASKGQGVFNAIEKSVKPVIAAINGFALGGGCELAMACHLRVASNNARFGQPEVKLGLIPGYGGTQRLTRLIGKTKAAELLMTADMITADEAFQLGLLNAVTTPELLMNKCTELAGKIIQQAPLAIAGIIRCLDAFDDNSKNGLEEEIKEFGKCFATKDFKEGASAFLEKRKPSFAGE